MGKIPITLVLSAVKKHMSCIIKRLFSFGNESPSEELPPVKPDDLVLPPNFLNHEWIDSEFFGDDNNFKDASTQTDPINETKKETLDSAAKIEFMNSAKNKKKNEKLISKMEKTICLLNGKIATLIEEKSTIKKY